ncbi:MAG: DUF2975 domain-containing protein [Patescibacteria group bacterium]|jgi:hypothetical protein
MKRGSTILLRGAVILIGLVVFALCVFVLPAVAKEMVDVMPVQYELLPILIVLAASTIPFYSALYQAWKLLNYIDINEAFSELSVKVLKNIKRSGIAVGLLYMACSPFLFIVADGGDAPGILAIGLVIIFASIVIATLSAVLQKVLQDALDIKSENDLTV